MRLNCTIGHLLAWQKYMGMRAKGMRAMRPQGGYLMGSFKHDLLYLLLTIVENAHCIQMSASRDNSG